MRSETLVVDARGLGCGDVLVRLAALRRSLEEVAVVEVLTDDAGAPVELPAWCRMGGHNFVGLVDPGLEGTARYQLVLQPPPTTDTGRTPP